jgi:WS/DGAT/MGAT family acyltransferase
MDRLKSLDAEFLHLENGIAHMHIAGACVFGGTPPPYDELVALIAGKMHEIPQYRQRIRPVPFELGRPVWVDDPDFDLEYHVRHTALPAPGDDATFARLMGRLMSQPLDRERALWEVWLVEGLEDGRWALVFKVHHSMVDGVAGVQLLAALLDIDPDAVPLSPRPWTPAPEPTAVAKVLDAWAGLASDVAASTRQLAGALRHPDRAVGVAVSTVSGLSEFIRNFGATTERTPESIIGPHRTWAHAAASLAEVKEVGKGFGGTVNDVVLAEQRPGERALGALVARDVVRQRRELPLPRRIRLHDPVHAHRAKALAVVVELGDEHLPARCRHRRGVAAPAAAEREPGDREGRRGDEVAAGQRS